MFVGKMRTRIAEMLVGAEVEAAQGVKLEEVEEGQAVLAAQRIDQCQATEMAAVTQALKTQYQAPAILFVAGFGSWIHAKPCRWRSCLH